MPELAEVETICRQLAGPDGVAGARIVVTDSRREPRWAAADHVGVVGAARRAGKWVVLPVTDDDASGVLVVRLGMTGALDLDPPADNEGPAAAPVAGAGHVCAWWRLADGRTLVLRDPRRFGGLGWAESFAAVRAELGPDPLDDGFVDAFATGVAGKRRSVKALLLDRRVVAGVGNYLADESCFRARVHPGSAGLSVPRARTLGRSLAGFARACLDAGGATFRTYRSLAGPGHAQTLFACYGRAGLPCVRCATPLSSATIAGRTTVWCPSCQPPVT